MSAAPPFWREALLRTPGRIWAAACWTWRPRSCPYLALLVLMYLALDVSYLLVLALAVPAAGFLVRTFIVFHDCAHGSFLPSKRANAWLGAALGLLVYTPFRELAPQPRGPSRHRRRPGPARDRRRPHAHRRGVPGVVAWRTRLGYRLFRNPLVMFGLGPIYAMVLQPRLVPRSARPRIQRSVIATNVALAVVVGALCWLVGWREFLLVQAPVLLLAGAAGVWLFYVQHQFEDTYWQSGGDWSYADAALRGSSYLKLPRVLQFFSGNIGLHHVHHLSAKVPNYNLQRAHDQNPIFHDVPTLSLWDGLRAVRLKLWDEGRGRLVTFAEARANPWPTATTSSSPTR